MLTVYGTMLEWNGSDPARYRHKLIQYSRWLTEAGCRGALIFTDNDQLDAWTTAQAIVAETDGFIPLVAVNPEYLHPFTVAQMVHSLGVLYQRSVDLNLVSGGFALNLKKLGGRLDHGQRYERLVEYGQIIQGLLTGVGPVSHRGTYYTLTAASLVRPLDPGLMPKIFVSGSSDDCVRARRSLAVERLTYPRELGAYSGAAPLAACGMRIGIIARADSADAWRVAHRRFPADAFGERTHDQARTAVESHWHREQSQDASADSAPVGAYWLYPFRAYRTLAPYLVGSYSEVGAVVARYRELGVRTVILDRVPDPDELHHARTAIEYSDRELVARGGQS